MNAFWVIPAQRKQGISGLIFYLLKVILFFPLLVFFEFVETH
jgi:hypothetical protein